MLDDLKQVGFTYATRSGMSIGIEDLIIPQEQGDAVREGARRGHQGRAAVPRRRDHQRRALQQGHRRVVGRHREDRRRDVQRRWRRRDKEGKFNPVYIMADSGARGSKQQIRQLAGHARPDGQAVGRNHRAADQGELPRRPVGARVLHLDARRAQGSGRYGAQDRRLGLPDAPSRRRGAGRDRLRSRLRHARRHRGAGHRRKRRDHRAAARPHHRPRLAREDHRPDQGRRDSRLQPGDRRRAGGRRCRTPASRRSRSARC